MPLYNPDKLPPLDTQDPPSISQPAPSGPGPLYRMGQIASVAGPAFDALTTLHGWNQGDQEMNGMIGNSPGKLAIAKIGGSAAMLGLMKVLEHSGHDKLAGALGLGSGLAQGAAGVHNLMLDHGK